jgi:alpha-beta hydrolase superfamily lysophospholipase
VLEPDGKPVGVAVFLHGLTDSPHSLRHIAKRYRDLGYVAIAIRLPAHGTVSAALTAIE